MLGKMNSRERGQIGQVRGRRPGHTSVTGMSNTFIRVRNLSILKKTLLDGFYDAASVIFYSSVDYIFVLFAAFCWDEPRRGCNLPPVSGPKGMGTENNMCSQSVAI
jgi:hypothetical protein